MVYTKTDDSEAGYAVVGTVTGDTVTIGSEYLYASTATYSMCVYDEVNSVVVVCYDNAAGKTRIGVVSGDSIAFGTEAIFEATAVIKVSASIDTTNNKVVVTSVNNTIGAFAIVGTVSGNSISFGSRVTIQTPFVNSITCCFDIDSGKTIIVYGHSTASVNKVVVATVTGTSISFGVATVFNSRASDFSSTTYNVVTGKVIIGVVGTDGYSTVFEGVVSGDTIALGDAFVIVSSYSEDQAIVVIPDSYRHAITVRDTGTSITRNVVYTTGQSNLTDLLGLNTEAVLDTETATITILGGVNANQTGLTIGARYYVDGDGNLTTTATDNVYVGRAISATEILVGVTSG